MKGKRVFTANEANKIRSLISQKVSASKNEQKRIRDEIRSLGFYFSDFSNKKGYTIDDFEMLIKINRIEIINAHDGKSATPKNDMDFFLAVNQAGQSRQTYTRQNSDEAYIIDLCDEVLEQKGIRQHRFDFLLGDADENGRQIKLPVDVYYPLFKLVIEYREVQHTHPVSHFDKPHCKTISGVHRGEQRKIYDQRRRDVLPLHGIQLIEISYHLFKCNNHNKIIRDRSKDYSIIKEFLKLRINIDHGRVGN